MAAYYNEFDPYAAQWLRNLIAAGHITPGDVDERSIEDVYPDDLRGYTQCHFFAGIGVWSYALRLAGWPDDRPVWTGSCPCQPFSAAGKGAGFDDERHLWPAWHHLIAQRRPAVVFGEQVASKDADPWIDLVQDDLEALGYAVGAVPFPSAGVGAPHIRDRLYWVAHAGRVGRQRRPDSGRSIGEGSAERRQGHADIERGGRAGILADAGGAGLSPRERSAVLGAGWREEGRAIEQCGGASGRLADANGGHAGAERQQRRGEQRQQPEDRGAVRMEHATGDGRQQRRPESGRRSVERRREPSELVIIDADTGVAAGPANGPWRDADWLFCRDGKWRPVEPGTFPLAHGAASRVGRLRAYGNAINAFQAQIFIEASMT
ncbi:DNA cytosine methyltransferase [Bordetella bronchialis]|uniref:DNA cytosine methyltransferase n=1 Tax=Bordetella bronchialis TaxID=463025 RepID=UPI003CFC8F33